ncbi:MAG: hypothetical protein H7246_12620 [Phycisphaerae bacterium]|nr:hypothetical protein [Saprospiraceae bacterium]
MKKTIVFKSTLALLAITLFSSNCKKDKNTTPDPTVLTASTNIQAKIDEYKALLGADNGGVPGTQGTTGFREINWDGLTDAECAPTLYIPDLFNSPTAPRSRGIVISTPGTGLMVSADSNNPTNTPTSFGNINPTYTAIFPAFSAERLFSPVGSNIANIYFYVPGSSKKAVVRGFGAVYVDVDRVENTAFEYFDINDNSLGTYATPVLNNGHVFLGVLFSEAKVHRVKIEYGNTPLGPNESGSVDVSVMDNFIYGEPQEAQ